MNIDLKEVINLYNTGKLDIAEKRIIKLISNYPNNFILHNLFGAVLAGQEKLDEAIINYKKSIQINSNYFEAYNNLGGALFKLKKFNESIDVFLQAIKINPNFTEAYYNLGNAFFEIKKFNESITNYQRAIKINPNYAKAFNNLGNAFHEIGKLNGSIKSYQKAIQINPNFADACFNLGSRLKQINEFAECIKYFKQAIRINPNFEKAYSNLGNLFTNIGKIDEAKKCFHKLININPDNVCYKINSSLLLNPIVQSTEEINLHHNRYIKNLKIIKKFRYETDAPGELIETNFFYLAFHNKEDMQLMKKISKTFKQIIPNINYVSKNINKKIKNKKIKIGFVSEFFDNHTIGKLFGGLIKKINRKKFEVIVIHTSKSKINIKANKVISLNIKIKEQQQQVEKENLDIIFYTDIGMSPRTYFLAFSKLAPVQIVSWGHPVTTGIDTIDYFLSSTLFEPDKKIKKYTERLVCLSQFPLYYEPPKNIGQLKRRPDFNLPKNARIYGCPQSLFKLHPDFDSILAKILERDEKGYLVFIGGKGKEKFWSDSLKRRWNKNFPIINERAFFINKLSLLEFISFCNCADVLLDPIHFGGGNTFLESMIVGTPTITMPGNNLKNNITAAAYKQMKISNPPIVKNTTEYINLAIKLAKNNKKNISLRKRSKASAKKYLYKNLKALKEFEQFLIDAHKAAQLGYKLKDGYVIKK